MNKKSITQNYIYNLTYQVLVLILPLITTPYVSRVLGAENIGIYSYTISITTYFILFGSLGVALYGQRQIAYEQKKGKKLSKTFWEIVLLRFIAMTISMMIFYFVFVNGKQYQIYYQILLLELLANCFDISWFFQGLEEFKKTVSRNMIIKLISVISIFAFVKNVDDLGIYFWIYVLSTLVGNLSLWAYLPKYLKKIKLKQLNIIQHIKPTIGLFVPQIAIQVYTILDKTMIGAIISNKSEVGYYEQSQKIIKILLTVITSLGTVMLPRIANTFANGDKEKVIGYMNKSFNMVFLLAFPMIFGIIAVSKSFVPVFFGPGYDKVIILMNIISPILLLIGLSNVTGTQYLLPTKRQKEYTFSVVCGAIINFIMNACLISKFGATGAAIGTIIAELTVTLIQMYTVRKNFKLKEIFKLSKNYVLSSMVMFTVCLFIRKFINNNFVSTIVQIIIGGITYGICLIIVKDAFILEMLNKIKSKIEGD